MKFFLSPRKKSRQITENLLIAGFAEHCPEKKIEKDGEPLSSTQQEQIHNLQAQVNQIRRQCGQIMNQASQSPTMQDMNVRIEALKNRVPTYLGKQITSQNKKQTTSSHLQIPLGFNSTDSTFYSQSDSDSDSIPPPPTSETDSDSDSETIPPPPTISPLQQRKALLRSARTFNNNPKLIKCLQDQIKELQQELRRQSGTGRVLVPTTSSSSYDRQVVFQGGRSNRRMQKGQGSDPGRLLRELPEFSMLVKMDKTLFKDDFIQDIVVLQKSPSHNYYKLASTDMVQRLEDGALYRFISPGSLETNTYNLVTNLESDSQQQLNESSNDKILVQINIPSSVTQQQGVILSNTFPFQDKDGSSYDKIITQHGGSFLGGKYYQKDLQQIFFNDNVKAVSPGDKFYKFISSKEFDPEKYSLVTSLSP